MRDTFEMHPIGRIRKQGQDVSIDVDPVFNDGLLGLEGFSHIIVCYWFHENDTTEKRRTLQVHPRRNPANPLTGVFATHSPVRPNLIAITTCRVTSIVGTTIRIDDIDARDGTPVIDIKCYIPDKVEPSEVTLPVWASGR